MKSAGLIAMALLLTSACSTSGYRRFYQGNLGKYSLEERGLLPCQGEPETVVGADRSEDEVRMLENGYRMIGQAFFEGADEGAGPVERMARELGASVVIAYRRFAGSESHSVRVRHLPGSRHVGPPSHRATFSEERFEQGASFWAKSAKSPSFGAFGRDDDLEREGRSGEVGVVVRAVVRESPALRCGVQRGDVVRKLSGHDVEGPSSYARLLEQLAGQPVEVEVARDGTSRVLACQLGK